MTEPDRSSELAAVSAEARAFFAQKHAARERALSLSRAVGQQSANAIRSAHRHEFEEARALLESARGAVAEMREHGNEFLQLSPEFIKAGNEAAAKWADEQAAENEWFKKAYDHRRGFQDAIESHWKSQFLFPLGTDG